MWNGFLVQVHLSSTSCCPARSSLPMKVVGAFAKLSLQEAPARSPPMGVVESPWEYLLLGPYPQTAQQELGVSPFQYWAHHVAGHLVLEDLQQHLVSLSLLPDLINLLLVFSNTFLGLGIPLHLFSIFILVFEEH